jgi:hypothetical protein
MTLTVTMNDFTAYAELQICYINLTLTASKAIDEMALIQKTIEVASAKMHLGVGVQNGSILESTSIAVDMYNANSCTVEMKVRASPRGKRRYKGVWGFDISGLPVTPGSGKEGPGPTFDLRGTYWTYNRGGGANTLPLLQAAAYWDPSIIGNVLNPVTGNFNTGLQPGQAGKTKES